MLEKLRGRRPTLIDMESYRRSAVVIPLIETENGYEVLFEVRAIGLKHQPGEICFPGGGCDRGEMPEAAALREICEELLLSSDQVLLEAPMDIFVSPFNMVIYPYLGTLKSYEGTYSRDEVLEIFTVPLTLADDEYFILCDYREGAKDSRYFGPICGNEIKGKVITLIRRSGI